MSFKHLPDKKSENYLLIPKSFTGSMRVILLGPKSIEKKNYL
jgi:hypothetical protein